MEKKRPSVAEILAAARKQDGGGAAAPEPAAPVPEAEKKPAPKPAAPKAEGAKPATAKAEGAKPAAGGARPSVQEMLAMARAEKEGAAAKQPAAAAPAKESTAAKPAAKPAPKPAIAKAEPEIPAGPKDTSSILAAASENKPGPMTKAEAAAKAPAKPAAKEAPRRPVPPMPVKPEYAKPKAVAKGEESTRRSWMLGIALGSMFAAGWTFMATTMGLWTLGFARFMFPNILTEPPSKFKVGFPGTFSPGQVETKFVAQFGVWIVNYEYSGQPQIYALRTVCTHLGCTPNWLEAEQKFKCPCHGSGFYKDGINFEGPAPRPLERFAIRLSEDGQLEVDKSKLFMEEQGQWADPNSFYTV